MCNDGILLRINDLCKSFGGVIAVKHFDATVKEKHLIGIIGPNGAGKTTILNLLSGIYSCDSGQIILQGRAITGLKAFEIGRLGISRTFQNVRLFEGMSVLDNVRSAFSWRANYGLLRAMVGWKGVRSFENHIEERAIYWLNEVGLWDYRWTDANSLPYGLQRKVELARALAGEPRLLLLDEPAAGLNPVEVRSLIQLIRKLFNGLKVSIVIIEHRMEVIMELCDWVYVQNFGYTIAQGTPTEIRHDPIVINAYLGRGA